MTFSAFLYYLSESVQVVYYLSESVQVAGFGDYACSRQITSKPICTKFEYRKWYVQICVAKNRGMSYICSTKEHVATDMSI
jgi:protein associated with RNAse G/E